MKRSFKLFMGLVAVLALVATVFLSASARQHYPDTHTTTFFVHGYGSSYRAEQSMARYMVTHGASSSIIRADISDSGAVAFSGRQPKNAKNPIVEVNYDAHHPQRDMASYGNWLKNVIIADQQRYETSRINLVGHSMGNIVTLNYLNDNLNDCSLPKVNHLVFLAGGIFPGYNQDSNLRQQLPSGLKVMNIYSDYANGTDRRIPNKYSRALRLIFQNAAKYKEVKLHGSIHSQLHESPKVDRLLINFLY